MGMKEPADMLRVCRIISDQLKLLGFKAIRNIQTAIIYPEKNEYLNYQYFTPYNKDWIEALDYRLHPDTREFAEKMLAIPDAYYTKTIEGKALNVWRDFRKRTHQLPDPKLATARSVHYYFYSIGPGALGISAYAPLDDAQTELFRRFRNVFGLAYRRFKDIEQAEAQAREAQIELGLERVRARAMAMHSSEELAALVATVFKEMTQLGFALTSSIIWVNDHENASNTLWIAGAEMKKPAQPFAVGPFHKDFFASVVHAWKARDPKWVYTLTGTKKKNFEKAFLEERPDLPAVLRKAIKTPKQLVFSASFNDFGALEIVETEALDDEKFEILHRFGKVFEQTYTRFLDLQKAEAQAREAQIELGLERVRAAAMAMHKLSDLSAIGKTIFSELKMLGFAGIRNTEIVINNDEQETVQSYHHSEYGKDEIIEINYKSNPIVKKWAKDLRKADNAFVPVSIPQKEIRSWDQYRKELGYKPDPKMAMAREVHYYSYSTGLGALSISTWQKLGGEEINILERFRNVFRLSYQRYIDIAKAEAQAREAQIELGLERVRARAMAMQKSDELSELVDTVFKELTKLDFALTWCIINIIDESSMSNTVWAANPDINKAPESYHMLFEDYPFHHAMMKGWKERNTKYVYTLEGIEKKVYDEYLFNETEFRRVPEAAQAASRAMEKYVVTFSFSNFGGLQTVGDAPLSDANLDILSRFGKVFDLTYTRFNDLKQAEAQAREAQIQLALERVRAKSLAMHHTSELQDVVNVVAQQLHNMGMDINGGVFITINDEVDKNLPLWVHQAPLIIYKRR